MLRAGGGIHRRLHQAGEGADRGAEGERDAGGVRRQGAQGGSSVRSRPAERHKSYDPRSLSEAACLVGLCEASARASRSTKGALFVKGESRALFLSFE